MNKPEENEIPKSLTDEYHNLHYLGEELNRGGQGVVFRTRDADLAIKQPLNANNEPDENADLHRRFQNIRLLPLPPRIPISLPLAILRNEPGYVMRLLNGMNSFNIFEFSGKIKNEYAERILPPWLAELPNKDLALTLLHYANTGSTRRRLFALSKCASILARLHSAGLVYGDISPNNAYIGDGDSREVWLIDSDNLCFETTRNGNTVYTPCYGAPEIIQGRDKSRPRTDCWSFAVMVFKVLSCYHPFLGKKVDEPDDGECGWDAEPVETDMPADLHERAYAGYLPFVDDEDDDSNATTSGLPRELVATPELRRLFQETLGSGRGQPHRRPAMAFWALELAKAFDRSLVCPNCAMSYFADEHQNCQYCDTPRPAFARAKTPRWEMLIPANAAEFVLRHRLFNPFSLEHNDDPEYEVVLDFAKKSAQPVRGENSFPPELSFEFVGVEK